MADSIRQLNRIILNLEKILEENATCDYRLPRGAPPRAATVVPRHNAFTGHKRASRMPARVLLVDEGLLVMQTQQDLIRGSDVSVYLLDHKDAAGETVYIIQGPIHQVRRVSGAYDATVEIHDIQQKVIPATKKLLECVQKQDPAMWNRWCQDLDRGPVLRGCDLSHQNLRGYDFCCANLAESDFTGSDLTGVDLSGADLSGARLDGVQIQGADLFRARLPSAYRNLVETSGTMEREAVECVPLPGEA